MTAILKPENKLTTSFNFSKLPQVQAWGLGALIPDAHSAGASSIKSDQSTSRIIDREEPCFVTKVSCFTHERAHWVNAVRNDPATKAEVERLIADVLGIVHTPFNLDSRVNLSNLDRTLHAALEKYAFFAVTGSLDTLNRLIRILEEDNSRRQEFYDARGQHSARVLDLADAAFVDPQYELVALRPKHMLPDGKVFVAYSRNTEGLVSHKIYVPGTDNTLRESPGNLDCPRFPPFSFDYPRPTGGKLNPFLVIINAEIKFRRYLRQLQPAPLSLPPDVMNLVDLTTRLVQLLYWEPVLRPGTKAEELFRGSGLIPAREHQHTSGPLDVEMGHIGGEEPEVETIRPRRGGGGVRRPAASATLEERVEYGQYLLSGRGKSIPLQLYPFMTCDFILDLGVESDEEEDLLPELSEANYQNNDVTYPE